MAVATITMASSQLSAITTFGREFSPSGASRKPYLSDHYLIVPGFHGSGAAHWQTWLEKQLPYCHRLAGVDWEAPRIEVWARAIGRFLQETTATTWIVAHSFGCLASARALALFPGRVAGILMVAPADPERFGLDGPRVFDQTVHLHKQHAPLMPSISQLLPQGLGTTGILVASENDPWMSATQANYWAQRWQLDLVNAGSAGHINSESGHGPWPQCLELLALLGRRQTRSSKIAR